MALKHLGFIFISPGFNKEKHIMESAQTKMSIIGVDMTKKDDAIDVAKELVNEGCQMIELCGGLGPEYVIKIREAIQDKAPVGCVMYGPEARRALLDIVSG